MQLIPTSSVCSWSKASNVRRPEAVSIVCPHCSKMGIFSLRRSKEDPDRLTVAATAHCPGCKQVVQFWAVRHEQKPKSDENNPATVYMFTTVRLHTTTAKCFKKVENATAVIWKILQVAESTFRRLKGAELLPAVYAGAQYVDGVKRSMSVQHKIAA